MILSPAYVARRTKPGRCTDSGHYGLALSVRKAKGGGLAKSWIQRMRIDGRWTNRGLGPVSRVSLRKARRLAAENYLAVQDGRNPFRQAKPTAPTFRALSEKVIETHAAGYKPGTRTAAQWRSWFARFVYSRIGGRPVNAIATADLLAIVEPLWHAKQATARKLCQRLTLVFNRVIAEGWRTDNPAGDALKAGLPRNGNGNGKVTHQRALPHAEVARALAKVRRSRGWIGARLAFEYMALTATRSGEARGVLWSEIDTERAVWEIPAERAKMGKPHRVPLSPQALDVLERARAVRTGFGTSGLVFTAARGGAMADAALSLLAKRLRLGAVPHGFRSSFRDWCAETGVSRELAEACLAHQFGSATERAYMRTDVLAARVPVMAAWGAYVSV